jgi:hypothetical protein
VCLSELKFFTFESGGTRCRSMLASSYNDALAGWLA